MGWLFALLGLFALAGGGGGKAPQRTPTSKPPKQGAQPDPDAPDDSDRGMFYVSYGIPYDDAKASVREASVLDLASNASGTLVVDALVRDENTPKRCVALSWRIAVSDGDIGNVAVVAAKRTCGSGSIGLKPSPPPYDGPDIVWYSEGGTVVMKFATKGRGIGVTEDDAPWFSPESYGSTTLGVDLRWRFE